MEKQIVQSFSRNDYSLISFIVAKKEKFFYDTNKITFQYLDLICLQRTKLPPVAAVGKSAKKNCL